MRLAPPAVAVAAALALVVSSSAVADDKDETEARSAARIFGQALLRSKAADLRPILPAEGKVHMSLVRLGPEEGTFAPNQVEALFQQFLSGAVVRSFDLIRLESDGRSTSLVHARLVLHDRDGRAARVSLHLAFQPEADRWVLREVKETAE